ncbi:hypothetical protein F8388_014640 [Cannabis sativa]|uniref:Uncharacterized protein n=1 Tax=Cannabis sativa TaxID=3483 RepID=A0A7J6E456_CANSA|nr:hypothetical protein F8388_014640 [Cannabis sativa]
MSESLHNRVPTTVSQEPTYRVMTQYLHLRSPPNINPSPTLNPIQKPTRPRRRHLLQPPAVKTRPELQVSGKVFPANQTIPRSRGTDKPIEIQTESTSEPPCNPPHSIFHPDR